MYLYLWKDNFKKNSPNGTREDADVIKIAFYIRRMRIATAKHEEH